MTIQTRRLLYLAIYLGTIAVFLLMLMNGGWKFAWHHLGILPNLPVYFDIRTLQAAIYSLSLGLNPHVKNPTDVVGRPMNYPMVWAYIAKFLHLESERNFLLFGTFLAGIFVSSCMYLLWRVPRLWMLLGVLSGAALFGIERGNIDIFIFSMLLVAVCVESSYLAAAILFVAVVLKIFPVFAAFFLLRNHKIFAVFTMLCGVFFFLSRHSLADIKRATPLDAWLSYGAETIRAMVPGFRTHTIYSVGTVLLLIVSLSALAIILYFLRKDKFPPPAATEATHKMFVASASIYVLSFAVLSNYDYRLIFLLLTIPYLLDLQDRKLRLATLLLILATSNPFWFVGAFGKMPGMVATLVCSSALYVCMGAILLQEIVPAVRFRGAFQSHSHA